MSGATDQLRLAFHPFQNRRLFADGFLNDRLPEWPEFDRLDVSSLRDEVAALWERERAGLATANEAQTEERFIQPLFRALGLPYTVQTGLRFGSGRRQPDYALFLTEEDRAQSDQLSGRARFDAAVAVADAKRFERALDGGRSADDPVAQIINYVVATSRPWGVLTNGRVWRLYSAAGDLVEAACYEIDLIALLESGTARDFRYFAAFFSAAAFAPDAAGRSFLDRALEESTANAVAVGAALERQVFAAVPRIAGGLLGDGERSADALDEAFENALVLLYRLLFCLHAEARGLLPVENPHYARYSLRSQKRSVAADVDAGRRYSEQSDDLYNDLRALFRIVDRGDEALGVAEYNGGLFSPSRHPYFEGRSVPDDRLAPALDGLYRVAGEFVDYRELSVRHLGTIYERLLQYRLESDGGTMTLVAAPGRRASGSYFTPEQVVDRIVERTLEPVLEARSHEIAADGLGAEAALERFLDLRVLDPAMGSAHFLVGACSYIARYVATDPSYDGRLSLADLQRLVAERCLHGVDINPLAVELAELALWLTTARRGEPLTFLHNLREGNSLVGADVGALLEGGESIFADRLAADVEALLAREAEIADPGSDVHDKERLARAAEALRGPLEEYASEHVLRGFRGDVGRPFHWELEFPEVFLGRDGRPRTDGGFDAVIGNPPWVRIQSLGRELADYARRRYVTAAGAFDTYVIFIERSLSLLGPEGRLGFIVPNKFLKLDYGRRLRGLLADRSLVEEIIDFGDAQVFAQATNYSCVVILDRGERDQLSYRRVHGDWRAVQDALTDIDARPAERFSVGALGDGPWILLAGEEARIYRAAAEGAARLDEVTEQIFTGLQTSADSIYIVEGRGRRGPNHVVYSTASDRELELEPDLLQPLASGRDVDRYSFKPLRKLLLFPYRRIDGEMRLLRPEEIAGLPLTAAYLRQHEDALRARERGRMDHDEWYALGRVQNLGAHDRPKLGVAATVQRLEVAIDAAGGAYFHNVRVNGILPDERRMSLRSLVLVLNSRLLDWVFRRAAAEHANQHFAANRQFIAPLPIRVPDASEAATLDELSRRLADNHTAIETERHDFLDWLSSTVGLRPAELPGIRTFERYDQASVAQLVELLRRDRARLARDPTSRAFRESLQRERDASLDRLAPLLRSVTTDEAAADDAVYELYGISSGDRAVIDAEYEDGAHP